jgi:hypothetical protein
MPAIASMITNKTVSTPLPKRMNVPTGPEDSAIDVDCGGAGAREGSSISAGLSGRKPPRNWGSWRCGRVLLMGPLPLTDEAFIPLGICEVSR